MSDAANTASAFAAVEHIIAGDWDHVLMRLQAAIRQRTLTTAYRNRLIARDDSRYGQWADSERQAQDELEKALRR